MLPLLDSYTLIFPACQVEGNLTAGGDSSALAEIFSISISATLMK